MIGSQLEFNQPRKKMFNSKKSSYTPLNPKPKSDSFWDQELSIWELLIVMLVLALMGIGFFFFIQWAEKHDAIEDEERRIVKNFTNLIEPTGLKLMELQLLDVLDTKPEAFKHIENEYQDYVKDQIGYFTKMIDMLKLNGEKLKTMDSWPAMKNVAKADVFAWFSRCHMFEEDMQNICFQQCKDLFPKLK